LKSDINYLIANPLAAKAAINLVKDKYKKTQANIKIITTGLTEELYEALKAREIYAALFDFNMEQARMALHLLIRTLNGEPNNKPESKFPLRASPIAKIIFKDNLQDFPKEQIFAAKNYKLVFEEITEGNK
jgi:ABC-type sugar transport system substrate-binding protein